MRSILPLIVLLLLRCGVSAGDLYHIHRLSEREVLKTYASLLRDACHFADRDWHSLSNQPAQGFWGDGVSAGNEGIRTVASMVLACAIELKYDQSLKPAERTDLLGKSTAALRFIAATHVTGPQKCPDGKHWGATPKFGSESWQSGMWTGTFATGAWLIWDQLDPGLQQRLHEVIAWEDDILAKRPPPNNLWLDTKAEENGWEVPCLVLGELMFPSDSRAADWHEAGLKYMMNTLCTSNDLQDATLVDGRAVNQWVTGANLQPEFTLENHNRFHPSYVGCSSYFMTQAELYYTYAGRPIPQAASHHVLDVWRMFRTVILPWGESAYPQGMDWELHGLPFINLFAALATHYRDPFAARMEQNSLQYLRDWQLMYQGSLTLPGSHFGIARHAINAEQAAYGLLAHKVFGSAVRGISDQDAAARESGVWEYPGVNFIEHRTAEKFASFSWENQIMGLLLPLKYGHDDNPDFSAPIGNGFVGSFQLVPRGDVRSSVVRQSWKRTTDGFETSGILLINGGRLRQALKMVSIGNQTVIYEDRVAALTNVTVAGERGLPLGIENDDLTGGSRTITTSEGHLRFDWQKPSKPEVLANSWVDVDGRLGMVSLSGSGLAYVEATGYSPGICVYTDTLYGSYSDKTRHFKTGEEVAHRFAICLVEASPKQIAAVAKTCHVENRPSGSVLRFTQPDGAEAEVLLLAPSLSYSGDKEGQ